jgi:hypothetical protein
VTGRVLCSKCDTRGVRELRLASPASDTHGLVRDGRQVIMLKKLLIAVTIMVAASAPVWSQSGQPKQIDAPAVAPSCPTDTTNASHPPTPARASGAIANQPGTISTIPAMVMNGVAGSITPTTSGNILVLMFGIANNNTANDGCAWKVYVGTGEAPANGAPVTGTSISANLGTMTSSSPALQLPFTTIAYAPALTVGTTYWIDLGFSTLITGGMCTLSHVAWYAIEE